MLASSPVRWGSFDIHFVSWNASGYPQLHRLTVGHLLTFFLTYLLPFCLPFFLTYLPTFYLNTGLRWSRLRSGREHWTWLLAVEAKEAKEEGEEEEEEEKTTNIKSNNPHLTGGEEIYIVTSTTSTTKAQVYPYKNWSWTCTPTHPPSQQQTQIYWNIMKYYCILLKQVQIECPYDKPSTKSGILWLAIVGNGAEFGYNNSFTIFTEKSTCQHDVLICGSHFRHNLRSFAKCQSRLMTTQCMQPLHLSLPSFPWPHSESSYFATLSPAQCNSVVEDQSGLENEDGD